MERIGDTYRIDLPGEYLVSATFNVSNLSLFDFSDLRTNSFEEGGDDANRGDKHMSNGMDTNIILPPGLITRACAKKIKASLQH